MELEKDLTRTRREPETIGFLSSDTMNRAAITAAIALTAFLLGFASMWITSKGYENERDSLLKTLRPSVLQNRLATASLDAGRGEFEQSRKQASDFFTDLRSEVDRPESAFGDEQRQAMESILARRDDTITLLARGDANAASRLSELYFNFVKAKDSAGPNVAGK